MSCSSAVRRIPCCSASPACSLERQCPVSAGSKSFNRKCLQSSTRNIFATFPVFIVPCSFHHKISYAGALGLDQPLLCAVDSNPQLRLMIGSLRVDADF